MQIGIELFIRLGFYQSAIGNFTGSLAVSVIQVAIGPLSLGQHFLCPEVIDGLVVCDAIQQWLDGSVFFQLFPSLPELDKGFRGDLLSQGLIASNLGCVMGESGVMALEIKRQPRLTRGL